MEVLLILLVGVALVAFLATWLGDRLKSKKANANEPEAISEPMEECCGAHEICETDLLNKMSEEIIYYEDEDLDAYKRMGEKEYNDEQIDDFREVLYSLKEKEIEGWLRSLELRKIELPSAIKSELIFMLVKN